MSGSGLLGADQIRELLADLGRRLDDRGLSAQLFLVGGAAMALAFNTRRSTRDLDAVFEPKSEVYNQAAAKRVRPYTRSDGTFVRGHRRR